MNGSLESLEATTGTGVMRSRNVHKWCRHTCKTVGRFASWGNAESLPGRKISIFEHFSLIPGGSIFIARPGEQL